jgi:hypothetical protein
MVAGQGKAGREAQCAGEVKTSDDAHAEMKNADEEGPTPNRMERCGAVDGRGTLMERLGTAIWTVAFEATGA